MFQPAIFHEERPDVMHALMRDHPFATLVSNATGGLTADHVPLVLHADQGGQGALRGHISVGNPLFRKTNGAIQVLTVFQGPQTYVTPSWYASKQQHGKVVPTWNYVVVHARGTLRFVRDPQWVLEHLQDLTNAHESHRPTPWAVSDAPAEFVARQMRGLVGFEIEITDLTGTWKVSQNKTRDDRDGVSSGLGSENTPDAASIAQLVRERARG